MAEQAEVNLAYENIYSSRAFMLLNLPAKPLTLLAQKTINFGSGKIARVAGQEAAELAPPPKLTLSPCLPSAKVVSSLYAVYPQNLPRNHGF
jgi:hypothetical protein